MSQLTDDILSQTDIVSTIQKYVQLKRAGSNFSGCCPFHNEKTASFMVSPTKQIFKCFGCGKGGNVITFLQEIERIDFRDAVKQLAKNENIDIGKYQFDKNKVEEYADEKEKIKRIHKLAQTFFKDELIKNEPALKYLKEKRKLDDEIIDKFGIGLAPESHYSILQYLKSKGFDDNDLIESSLAKKNQSGDIYSFFRNRITFPIFDTMGNTIGFGARSINPEDMPKYINSGEHKAYDKGNILYGLNWARQEIKAFNFMIIVEGYMDVIALKRLGFPVGIATCGTSITEQHVKLLKRYTENIFFLFDSDQAGQTATIRALNIAYQNDLFPKKILLPEGIKDVDELANTENGKEIFENILKKASDGFVAIFSQLLTVNDISSPIDKQKILNVMFGLILNINNISMQDHYVNFLADKTGSSYEVLLNQFKQFAKNEGKFLSRQTKKIETKFQMDREMLSASLFYQNYINQFVETSNLRNPLINIAKEISIILPESILAKSISTEYNDEKLAELQLRRENELNHGKEENKRYTSIKQIVGPIFQLYIQSILKSKSISDSQKQKILSLKKDLE